MNWESSLELLCFTICQHGCCRRGKSSLSPMGAFPNTRREIIKRQDGEVQSGACLAKRFATIPADVWGVMTIDHDSRSKDGCCQKGLPSSLFHAFYPHVFTDIVPPIRGGGLAPKGLLQTVMENAT